MDSRVTENRLARGVDPQIEVLLRLLGHAFDQKAWHGTTFRGALHGVGAATALWRPGPGRHNIWELTVHAAYWKYVVRRRLTGEATGSFARGPSNWPKVPEQADAKAWKGDIRLLEAEHVSLLRVVSALGGSDLRRRSPKGTWTLAEEIEGIAAHDLYHTGQIQLLKRLMPAHTARARRPR
jgi:DinB superfamily